MTYYPNVPARDPRAGTSGERTARILCIVIAVLTVVISFPILVTTQTSVSHESAAAPPPSGPSRDQVLARFPQPTGAVPITIAGATKAYRVRSTLAAVKAFYEAQLPSELQTNWNHEMTLPSTSGNRIVTAGYKGDLYGSKGVVDLKLTLEIDDGRYVGGQPNYVLIKVAG